MKKIVTLIIVVLFSSIGCSTRTKIDFKAEQHYRLWNHNKGNDTGIRVFEFTNTGDAPLVIFAIQSSNVTIISKSKILFLPEQLRLKLNIIWFLVLLEKQLL
jgi:hypothetical protein